VAFQKISTCVATGEGADVFQVGTTWNATFAVTGALEEIDMDDFGGEDKFVAANLGTAKFKGAYYGVPWFAETRALFYNKDTFKEVGVNPPKTMDELVEVGKKIIAKKGKGTAIAIKGTGAWDLLHDWAVLLWANGGDVLSKDNKKALINSSIAHDTMIWYIDLVRNGLASKACAEYNQPQSRATFISGSTAMIFCNPGDMSAINADNPKLNYGIVEPPAGKKGKASFAGGSNLVILKASKNKDAALKWAQFLSKPENAADYCKNITQLLPVLKEAYNDPYYSSGNFKVFKNILTYANAYPSLSVWGDVEVGVVSEFSNILSDYINGKLTDSGIKKYLNKANKKVNAALAKEK
jgi:multiple sugar transport system substrate-binding protein